MNLFMKLLFSIGAGLILLISLIVNYNFKSVSPPHLKNTTWWGPERPFHIPQIIRPFKLVVEDEVMEDLRYRLKNYRNHQKYLENVQHEYGINSNLLDKVIDFWKNNYSWSERQDFLNKFPQHRVVIQGLDIHYLRVKPSTDVRVFPLLLIHGWPGSIREFYEVIPILTTPQPERDFAFEVIVPSLLGHGFSRPPAKVGLGSAEAAVILMNLMRRLGFEEFYVQGGTLGALVATDLAILYPEHVKGLHLNFCVASTPANFLKYLLGSLYPPLFVDKQYEQHLYPLSDVFSKLLGETGNFHLQATKPDTIGAVLHQSPVGIAAYILEKFITWTNFDSIKSADGGLAERFDFTALLDNIMVYWITGTITSSIRFQAETFSKKQLSLQMYRIPVEVPTACARFKHELIHQPENMLRDKYPRLVRLNEYEQGGHFAALEVPSILAEDIWSAVEIFEKYDNRTNK